MEKSKENIQNEENQNNPVDTLANEPSFEERNKRIKYGEEMSTQMEILKNGGSSGRLLPHTPKNMIITVDFNNPYSVARGDYDAVEELKHDTNLGALRTLGQLSDDGDYIRSLSDIHNNFRGDIDAALLDSVYSTDRINPEQLQRYKEIKKDVEYVKKCYEEYNAPNHNKE